MSDHFCSVCHEDAEEDRDSFCGDYSCCSPSYLLPCGCAGAFVEYGDKPKPRLNESEEP